MNNLTEYLNNPCGTLSIPYWKAKNITIPSDMRILHDRDFSSDILSEYNDDKYFRLYHNLKEIPKILIYDFEITTATKKDIKSIVQIINDSYTDISVNKELINSYTQSPVYNDALWIMVKKKTTGKYVGCGIADYDEEAKVFVDKNDTPYYHIIDMPENYGFACRNDISRIAKAYPHVPLKLSKALLLNAMKKYNYHLGIEGETQTPIILIENQKEKSQEIFLEQDIMKYYQEKYPNFIEEFKTSEEKEEQEPSVDEEVDESTNTNLINMKELIIDIIS